MLVNLYIENYVLFDKQNLSFNDGFIAVTGDTGAGKSLIIDALGYLCGDRLTTSIQKDKRKNTFIEANFIFRNTKTLEILKENGISEEEVYIVSREITPDNRSISRINGRSVTLSLLKKVFENELDIHSQSDNQYLLSKSVHLNLVDAYAKHDELLQNTKLAYKNYKQILDEINEVQNTFFNESEIEFLKAQVNEIEKVSPNEDEYNELSDRLKQINAYEHIYSNINNTHQLFSNNNGLIDTLYEGKNSIDNLQDYDEYNALVQRVNSLYIEAVDINDELSSILSTLAFDEYEVNNIEERLLEINRIIRRHGGSFEIFNERLDDMKNKIEVFDSKDIVLFELEKKLKVNEEVYENYASQLTTSRLSAIKKLEKDVLIHLKDLHLENADFKILLQNKPFSSTGNDDIEFMVAMNKGFALESLIKVASGGEISRLMLGLKVVFSQLFGVGTVIFDEIDTGVSGVVASSIGRKMQQLSKYSQVFAVTHLAQVAASSNDHYYVEKDNSSNIGTTTISKLEGNNLISKLAIMSTGIETEASLKAAKELYKKAQEMRQ